MAAGVAGGPTTGRNRRAARRRLAIVNKSNLGRFNCLILYFEARKLKPRGINSGPVRLPAVLVMRNANYASREDQVAVAAVLPHQRYHIVPHCPRASDPTLRLCRRAACMTCEERRSRMPSPIRTDD